MLTPSHEELKTQVVTKVLELFPEAKSVLLWGGSVAPDFSIAVNDVDVIIEIDTDFMQEVVIAERLKTLVQTTSFCRLDPFVYLTEVAPEEPLEFIAPFGFYKANPFIPYLIQNQHELVYGKSRLLKRLTPVSLNEALVGLLPQVMGALKRSRMDAQVEQDWAPLLSKHRSYLFVIIRTYFAFEQGGVGSKQEALRFLVKKFPQFQLIADQLGQTLAVTPPVAAEGEAVVPTSDMVLDFVRAMETALPHAKRRVTAH